MLYALTCGINPLNSLDVSNNTALAFINCSSNGLTNLDLSNNNALIDVRCFNNELTILNIKNGNNLILTSLNAQNNLPSTCIQVDNEIDANNGAAPYNTWYKDAEANYSEDCSALSLNDEMIAQSINIYPNPISQFLNIDSKLSISKVEIFSIFGNKVKEINSDFKSINVNDLSSGIYLLKFETVIGYRNKLIIKK